MRVELWEAKPKNVFPPTSSPQALPSPPNQRSTEAWGRDSCCLCFSFFMKLFSLSRVGPLCGPQFCTWLLQYGFFMGCIFLRAYSSFAAWGPLQAAVWLCSLAWSSPWAVAECLLWCLEYFLLFLLWSWCLQHSFSNFLPHSALWCTAFFTLFNLYFYRWPTSLADRLSCTLQWIHWIWREPSASSMASSHADQVCSSLKTRLCYLHLIELHILSNQECSEQNRRTVHGTVVRMWLVSLCRQGMQEGYMADQFLLIWE